ncbi:sensor histidine kinase [Aquipuribacter nitratireducens]|uniref:histidine kinase n=1 Tax=Aquipuribacter nitratireducens TaxID=650104 RepID=A0ABW0GNV1_9MICO
MRARVLLAVMVTVTVALLGFVLVLERVLVSAVDRRVEQGLTQEVAELRRLAEGVDPETAQPFAGDVDRILEVFLARNIPAEREVFVTIVDGTVRDTTRPLPLPATEVERWSGLLEPERDAIVLDERRYEYLVVPLVADGEARATFAVLFDYTGERREITRAIRRAEAVAALLLLVAVAVGWLAAGRALAPLRLLTATAKDVESATDLSRRLPDPRGSDEVATLTRTFNGMLDRLEQAFAVQRDFVADAGHELRTPLTIVRGHLELLGDDPAERRETTALVMEELDRMSRMVDDLLLLAKSGRPDFLQLREVDVGALLRRVAAKAEVMGARRWEVAAPDGTVVVADEQRLTQALVQLASNAVAHTDPADRITFGGAVAGGLLHLWVLDEGDGIGAGDRERVFDRFARAGGGPASPRRRVMGEGAGLGLSIVRAIAEAHGGTVELLSTPGTGSAFVLVLPGTAQR